MFTKEQLAETLAVCEKATPEPWHIVKNHLYHSEIKSDKRELIACIETVKEGSEEHNAQFIALARTALPQLAQRVVDLEKQLESLTPGGSEFYNDPERCIQWVKDRLATVSKQVKKRKEAEAENAKLRATIAAMQDALEEVKARCELRRQDDDAHYENYYEAKQALAAAGYRSNQP